MTAPWIEASRYPRIPGTRAHAAALTPLVGLLVYFSWITVFVVLVVTVAVVVLTMKGMSAPWLLRRMKSRLRGGATMARPVFYRRRVLMRQSIPTIDIAVFSSVHDGDLALLGSASGAPAVSDKVVHSSAQAAVNSGRKQP